MKNLRHIHQRDNTPPGFLELEKDGIPQQSLDHDYAALLIKGNQDSKRLITLSVVFDQLSSPQAPEKRLIKPAWKNPVSFKKSPTNAPWVVSSMIPANSHA